jgi:phosphate:Na+ symporter
MAEIAHPHLQALLEALGGGGLFIFGIRIMSEGLQRIAGNRFRTLLAKAVSTRLSAALLGTSLASVLQSSSSASILTVGFLNAGLISIYQALAIFLGTALGAALAIQFIAFQPHLLALPAIFAGVLLKFFFKRRFLVSAGELLLGAGILFLGLRIMETGLASLSATTVLTSLDNYVFAWRISAVLFGSLLTFIVQSPSIATGLIIAFCSSGIVSFNEAVGIVIGANLGIAFITLFAATGGTIPARKAAITNLLINFTAILFALLLFPLLIKAVIFFTPINGQFNAEIINSPGFTPSKADLPRLIANAYTIFSLFLLASFLPLIGYLSRTVKFVRTSENLSAHPKFLDRRILNTPTIALMQAAEEIGRMAKIVATMYDAIVILLYRFDARSLSNITEMENTVDALQKELSNFLVLLSREELDPENAIKLPQLLQIVNQLEHIADINMKLLSGIQKKKVEKITFSPAAMTELKRLAAAVNTIITMIATPETVSVLDRDVVTSAQRNVDEISDVAISGHIKRMKSGHCTVEAGFLYNDLITALVSISNRSAHLITDWKDLNESS